MNTITLTTKIKVELPKDSLKKIQYLCRLIPSVEWSGVLLYTTTGSIKKPETFKIEIKDIIPMDKGSKAYTEYSYNSKSGNQIDDKMIDYVNERPEMLEENWKMGHIHSHNSMSVFFSGTDTEELCNNAKSHNFYLSVIVNNWGDILGKIAIYTKSSETIKRSFKALDENGQSYKMFDTEEESEKEQIFIYECEIEHESLDQVVNDELFVKFAEDIVKKSHTTQPAKSTAINTHLDFQTSRTNVSERWKRNWEPVSQSTFKDFLEDEDTNLYITDDSDEFLVEILLNTLYRIDPESHEILEETGSEFLDEVLEALDSSRSVFYMTFSKTFIEEVKKYSAENEIYLSRATDSNLGLENYTRTLYSVTINTLKEYSFSSRVAMWSAQILTNILNKL